MNIKDILSYLAVLAVGFAIAFGIWGTGGTRVTGTETTSTVISSPGSTQGTIWSIPQTSGTIAILPQKPVQPQTLRLDTFPDSIKLQTVLRLLGEANAEIHRLTQTSYTDTNITIGDGADTLKPSLNTNMHLEFARGQFAYRFTGMKWRVPIVTTTEILTPNFFSRLFVSTHGRFPLKDYKPSFGASVGYDIESDKITLTPKFGYDTQVETYIDAEISYYPFR